MFKSPWRHVESLEEEKMFRNPSKLEFLVKVRCETLELSLFWKNIKDMFRIYTKPKFH